VSLKAPEVLAVERPTRTNYVIGYMNSPSRGSPDFIAFQRGMSLFSGVLSDVVRGQATLSYSAFATVFEEGATGAAFYMSTTQPDSALKLVDMVTTLLSQYDRDVTIPRHVLRKAAESYTTAYVFGTESADSHAAMLARAHMYQGDFRLAARQAEIAGKVSFADMRNAVRTYAKNIQYVYVGDLTKFTQDRLKKR
jgi:predicted Zn-dependent peptidase